MTQADKQAIASRFITFRNEYVKYGQTELAKEIGITQKTMSFIENGHALPSQKTLTHLSKKYNLNPEWMMSGKGDPVSKATANPKSQANIQSRLALLENRMDDIQSTLKKILEKLSP